MNRRQLDTLDRRLLNYVDRSETIISLMYTLDEYTKEELHEFCEYMTNEWVSGNTKDNFIITIVHHYLLTSVLHNLAIMREA